MHVTHMEEVTLGESQLSYALYPHKGTNILNEKHDLLHIDLGERRSVYKRQMKKNISKAYTHTYSSVWATVRSSTKNSQQMEDNSLLLSKTVLVFFLMLSAFNEEIKPTKKE